MRRRLAVVVALPILSTLLALTPASPASAAQTPPGLVDTVLASGLDRPTAMTLTPDGRVLVAEQEGRVRVVGSSGLVGAPAIDLVVDATGERGLLGIDVDPNFATNGHVFLHYTATTPTIHNRLSRFTMTGNTIGTGTEVKLLDLPTLGATNHNGGAVHVGPDGKLYLGVGENNVGSNAQSLNNPLGKILRLNTNGTIPSDNPFFSQTTGNNRAIWALGLRNPFTFNFSTAGRMFINDVGEVGFEEINEGAAGANFGWPNHEGFGGAPTFVDPLFAYGHGEGASTGCAIAGGAFYPANANLFGESFTGNYFYADLCSGWIRRYRGGSTSAAFLTGRNGLVDLLVKPNGKLLYLARGGGILGQVAPPTGPYWFLKNHPSSGPADIGFGYGRPNDQPLACDWNGDGIDTQAVFRAGDWHLKDNFGSGAADDTFHFGRAGDTPLCGDWNGDGIDTVGVHRGDTFLLNDSNRGGPANHTFHYGMLGDDPLTGDWNGDGVDSPGVARGAEVFLRDAVNGGRATRAYSYGLIGEPRLVGDFDDNGTDTLAIRRDNVFMIRNKHSSGSAQVTFSFGSPADVPVIGDWNRDGRDGVAVVRGL